MTGPSRPRPVPIPCYETAALWLVSVRQHGGGFAPEADAKRATPSETDTALALLVLTRAAWAWHPVRPEPFDAGTGAPGGALPPK